MRQRVHAALALIAAAALSVTGVAQSTGQDEVVLRSAISREVVDGDRPGAMQLYRQLVTSSNRAVATEASSRLAALEAGQQPGRVQVRRLFEGAGTRPSRDGRLIPVIRDGLHLYDVAAGSTRRLVSPPVGRSAGIDQALVSPSGRQVAYAIGDFERGDSIRLINVNGTGDRVLITTEPTHRLLLHDWSVNGQHVLVSRITAEPPPGGDVEPETFLVAVTNGVRQQLDVRAAQPQFTPDGRFVVVQASGNLFSRPVAGGPRVPLVEHPASDGFVGWAPDGRLVFVSDRSGRRGLWALRVQEGRPQGEPELIVGDFGQNAPLGISSTGNVFYRQNTPSIELYLARLDASSRLESGPTPISTRFTGVNTEPDYSRDGRFLAYVTGLPASVTSEIRIRTLATGEERVLAKPIRNIAQLRWYPDGRALLLRGGNGNGQGMHRLDIETGATTVVMELTAGFAGVNQTFSPDGRFLYFIENKPPDVNVLSRMDLSNSTKEEVFRPSTGYLRLYALSADGTEIAYNLRRSVDGVDQDFLYARAVAGGEARLVHTVSKDAWARAWGGLAWSADGRYVFYHEWGPNGGDRLTKIPAGGGAAERVLETGIIRRIAVHPDGRQLALEARSNSNETFVMEGVFPPARR